MILESKIDYNIHSDIVITIIKDVYTETKKVEWRSIMERFNQEVNNIKDQIVKKYKPKEIILFGSVAKGIFKVNSDIDLCIIKDTDDKRKLLADMYICIDSKIPFDLVLYTDEEWSKCINDKNCFAYIINNTGVKIYG